MLSIPTPWKGRACSHSFCKAPFNQFQLAVISSYENGEFEYLTLPASPGKSRDCLYNLGDTLLQFLLIELSDKEDCDTAEEAARRVEKAQASLTPVIDVLHSMVRS